MNCRIQASPSKQVMIDSIVATENEQAAAKEFLNWIVYSEIGQQMLVKTCNVIPPFINNPYEPADPLSRDIYERVQAGEAFNASAIVPNDHWSILGSAMQKYLAGRSDREELIESIQDYWDPFVYGVYLTLTDWNGVSKVKNFVGLKNFAGVMRDGQFWTSLLLTFKYVIVVVLLVNVLAFGIAYLLTRGMKGQNFFRAGFFTPNLIGGIVLGYIWQFVFSRVFVSIGETTGWKLFEVSWLSDPDKAFAALVLVSVWQLSGYMILIYVAGFMGLSEDVMEAAQIDGASGFVKLKSIIMPLMMSSVTICLFLTLSRAFMVYDVNLSLTAGAPYGTTEMAAMHVYEKAFTSRQFGVGQAEALILFVIVACISGIQVYLTKKQEVEA